MSLYLFRMYLDVTNYPDPESYVSRAMRVDTKPKAALEALDQLCGCGECYRDQCGNYSRQPELKVADELWVEECGV